MPTLTQRQRDILLVTAAYQRTESGLPPTFPAISVALCHMGPYCIIDPVELELELQALVKLGLLIQHNDRYFQRTLTAAGWHELGMLTLVELESCLFDPIGKRPQNEKISSHERAVAMLPKVEA